MVKHGQVSFEGELADLAEPQGTNAAIVKLQQAPAVVVDLDQPKLSVLRSACQIKACPKEAAPR